MSQNTSPHPAHDFSGAAALGISSVCAYAVVRWFDIWMMIEGFVESERHWGDSRSGLGRLDLLLASPPLFFLGCFGVNLMRRSFINAKRRHLPLFNLTRTACVIALIPFALWILFWVVLLLRVLAAELRY